MSFTEPVTEPVNLAVYLRSRAKATPEAIAVQADGQTLSFAALDDLSDRYAGAMQAAGLGPGMRTALMVSPGFDFVACAFALFKLGALPVMVDPGLGLKEVGACLRRAHTEAFVGVPKAHLARVLGRWSKGRRWRNIWVGRPGFNGRMPCLHPGITAEAQEWNAGVNPDQAAAVLFTSGSTGQPKGVLYTHRMFLEQLRLLEKYFQTGPGGISVPTFPLFALFDVALGMRAIIPRMNFTRPATVEPLHIIELIQKHGVTHMFGSPALIARVGDWAAARHYYLPTLKTVISAGAPVPPPVLDTFASLLSGDATIFTPYGATEALPMALIDHRQILGETRDAWAKGAGVCVGQLVDGLEAAVIPIHDDPIAHFEPQMALAQGEVGEIVVRGAQVSQVYDQMPAATLAAKMTDGRGWPVWHRTGDMGRFDESGRLWFLGRKAHRVECRGELLLPIPCEAVFNQHPAVRRSALVRACGQAVICIERHAGFQTLPWRELQQELFAIAQEHAHTRAITAILEHPAFPVDIRHNAKIRREVLATWAAKRL